MRLAAVVLAAAFATPAMAAGPAVEKIEARLFYQHSATLSDNVAAAANVALWNTVIGEGGAAEPADDVLIVVTVKADPSTYVEAPLVIVVTGQDGRAVASRKIDGLLVGAEGRVARAIYLQDTTCEAITVDAMIGNSKIRETVPFACGE